MTLTCNIGQFTQLLNFCLSFVCFCFKNDIIITYSETIQCKELLLIDVLNAFNALNRAAALHNINLLCPIIATYAINTYRREPARLFVIGGKEIVSAEGTSQGDALAMGLYAYKQGPV